MQDITLFMSNHPLLVSALFVVLALSMVIELLRAKQKLNSLTPIQATQMMNHQQAQVIDVRSAENFRKGHIINAQNIMPQDFEKNAKKLARFKSNPFIIVCGLGKASQKVAASLKKQGYNAFSLAGGMRAWQDAQMPIIKE
ncbi:MAG: rhodanese-like domain-containing protein [Gammaproteobacteria bacterium]|nr:rhodanese-like domain-containing protein [Gammaproteobacteria bacterium]